ncbi:MAG: hypothetical protein D6679_04970 [Candidatus Hydrogenedentota bacterium]|nr:MAG: hypothetical protein D6679_04970 [Candidatus Hydrogenedentota bacterium]
MIRRQEFSRGGLLPPGARTDLFLLLCLFFFVRVPYLAKFPVSGDEGVFGMMSYAIGIGDDYPLYCWGAHYASALVSYIAAAVMRFAGPGPGALKAAVLPYSLLLIPLFYLILRRLFERLTALLATGLLAIPPPVFLEMQSQAHGGYPETFFLGATLWFVAADIGRPDASRSPLPLSLRCFLLGLLWAASFSILWLGVPFILAAATVLYRKRRSLRFSPTAFVAGSLLGLFPFLAYNLFLAPGRTLLRLAGRALHASRAQELPHGIFERLFRPQEWCSSLFHGFSEFFQPVGGATAGLLLLLLALWGFLRLRRTHPEWAFLTAGTLLFSIPFDFLGDLSRVRHLSPLWLPLLVLWAALPRRGAAVFLAALLVANGIALRNFIHEYPTPREAIAAAKTLRDLPVDAFVSDYEYAYRTVFLSRRYLPVASIAPPNPTDRRPDWTEKIRRESRRPALFLEKTKVAPRFARCLIEKKIPFSMIEFQTHTLFLPRLSATFSDLPTRCLGP